MIEIIYLLSVSGENQLLVEDAPDGAGDIAADFTAAFANVPYLAAQYHGIQYLHHLHQFAG